MAAGAEPAQTPAGQHLVSRLALNLYQSGTSQCWTRLGGPRGDKIVFPVGTCSGTATRAVPKPELMTCTFSCRIYAGIAIVWGGSSGTGRHRPRCTSAGPKVYYNVCQAALCGNAPAPQHMGTAVRGYGTAHISYGSRHSLSE
jgi:hypothetical protein